MLGDVLCLITLYLLVSPVRSAGILALHTYQRSLRVSWDVRRVKAQQRSLVVDESSDDARSVILIPCVCLCTGMEDPRASKKEEQCRSRRAHAAVRCATLSRTSMSRRWIDAIEWCYIYASSYARSSLCTCCAQQSERINNKIASQC